MPLFGRAFCSHSRRGTRRHASGRLLSVLAAAALGLPCSIAAAQSPASVRYYPYDQTVPPGMAGQWSAIVNPGVSSYYQPVRVELPVPGQVTFFSGGPAAPVPRPAPAQAAILVGPVYRLKISDMPDYPGLELYPTVELLDRLHPPAGRSPQFPVPVSFTIEELDFALEGRLVTKVVYLEQPDRAAPVTAVEAAAQRLEPQENGIAIADRLGRPMAIVRLGGRLPDPNHPEPGFYGSGAPVLLPALAVEKLAKPQAAVPRNRPSPH